ncbi:hypothetical protein BKA62DRAFT_759702 [Auriculariales sp. MPI-PUGE-AT-0066]|nr:hypothetical protein BKA62DRAFT_759702 [Auriculariales sp. MPI-PUGE-AT-0066]
MSHEDSLSLYESKTRSSRFQRIFSLMLHLRSGIYLNTLLFVSCEPACHRLSDLQQRNGRVACLDVSAQDFREFLWFLNANPSTFDAYATRADVEARFLRWLAVATVANRYNATEISRWTVKKMVELLPRYECSSTQLVRLYRLAQELATAQPSILLSLRLGWARKIDQSPDPVVWIIPARDVGDNSLQAQAYLYVLKRCSVQGIAEDARLGSLDRFRLFVGAANMRDKGINVGEHVASVAEGRLLWICSQNPPWGLNCRMARISPSWIALAYLHTHRYRSKDLCHRKHRETCRSLILI